MQEQVLIRHEEPRQVQITWGGAKGNIGRVFCPKNVWQPSRGRTIRRCYYCKNYAGRTKVVILCVLKQKEI